MTELYWYSLDPCRDKTPKKWKMKLSRYLCQTVSKYCKMNPYILLQQAWIDIPWLQVHNSPGKPSRRQWIWSSLGQNLISENHMECHCDQNKKMLKLYNSEITFFSFWKELPSSHSKRNINSLTFISNYTFIPFISFTELMIFTSFAVALISHFAFNSCIRLH